MWTSENRARYDRDELRYPSDVTDAEWAVIEPLIPAAKRGGRRPKTEASPTAAIIDSQSVKSAEKGGVSIDPHGFDAGKKIKGKKRHILVDTRGLLLIAIVHHRYPLTHCLRSGCYSVCLEPYTGDRLDGAALLAEVINVGLLVSNTALAQHVQERISPGFWLGQAAFGDRNVQLGWIAAI